MLTFPSTTPAWMHAQGGHALLWAKPYLEYALARVGKRALPVEADGVSPGAGRRRIADTSSGSQSAELWLRGSKDGALWFAPKALEDFAGELERSLNFLAGNGPGGRFKVGFKPDRLQIAWSSAGSEGPGAQDARKAVGA